MDIQLIILANLGLTMALFGLALAIAWARFGRHTHVALWSAAFFASAFGNLGFVFMISLPSAGLIGAFVGVISSIVSASLFCHGFRRRAHIKEWRGLAILTCTMIVAMVVALAVRPDGCLGRMGVHACDAVLFLLSARALRSDPHGHVGAARAVFWMLIAFSSYIAALAVVAIFAGPGSFAIEHFYATAFLVGVPAGMVGIGLFSMLLVASDLAERLHCLATLDPLTGVLNRRGFEEAAGRMLAQSLRLQRPMTVVIADLDRFKAINDRFGHALGDIVLQRFAAHCEAIMRKGDLVGRLGGEEFVLVLADAGPRAAAEAIERLRGALPAALADLALPVPVTASFGIAGLADRGDTLATMLVRADVALYESKADGRDRVSFARDEGGARSDPRFLAAFTKAPAARDEREAVCL